MLHFDNHFVNLVSSVRYLGVILDFKLNWHEHILSATNKIFKDNNVIDFFRVHVCLSNMYYGMFFLTLCMWFSFRAESLTNHITVLQNKFIRTICRADYCAPVPSLVKPLNLILFEDMYEFLF